MTAVIVHEQVRTEEPQYPIEANPAHWFAGRANIILPFWHGDGLWNVSPKKSLVAPAYSGNSRTSVDAFGSHYNVATIGDYIDCGAVAALQVNSFTLLCVLRPGTISAITTIAQSNFRAGGASDSGAQFRLSAAGKVDLIKDNVAVVYTGTRALTTARAHAIGLSYDASSGLCSVAIDGTPDGTATTAQTFAHNKFVLGRKRGNDTAETQLHRNYLFAHSGVVASMAELCELTANPWAIFEDDETLIHVPTAGGTTTYTLSASMDAAIQRALSGTASMDAAIQVPRTATASLDAAVQAPRSAAAGLDAAIQTGRSAAAGLDAAIRRALTATAGLDAVLVNRYTAQADLDAAIRYPRSVTAAMDAFIDDGSGLPAQAAYAGFLANVGKLMRRG